MSFATFADLKLNVRNAFNDREPPAFIYDLVTAELNTRLRVLQMETVDAAFAISAESTALPADFISMRSAYLNTTPRVKLDLADEFSKNADFSNSGRPYTYTIVNGFLLLNPVPDGAYTATLRYIASMAAFSADGDTNTVLTTYPATFFYCALKHSSAWEGDGPSAQAYDSMLNTEIVRIMKREVGSRFSAGPLRGRSGQMP